MPQQSGDMISGKNDIRRSKETMKRKEAISAIVLLSFSIAISYQAGHYPFGTVSKVGPGFVPFYLGIVLAVLSISILIKTILKPKEEGRPAEGASGKRKLVRVFLVFFSMAAYAFLIDKLGFPITTFLFTLVLFKFIESYGWVSSTLGALGTSLGNYLIFDLWLQCQFPKGFWGI
jgi:putative tricarboxylic transport membrane protein